MTSADIPSMTDQDLLDFIGMTEADPEAYIAKFAAEQELEKQSRPTRVN